MAVGARPMGSSGNNLTEWNESDSLFSLLRSTWVDSERLRFVCHLPLIFGSA